MAAQQLTYSGELVVVTCWCGTPHAVPATLRDHQLRQHDDGRADVIGIYCPLGHQHVPAGESKLDQQRRRAEEAEARAQAAVDQLAAEARARKRAEKRAAAALCPVEGCGRQFVNLGRHMHSKHPELVHPEAPGKRKAEH